MLEDRYNDIEFENRLLLSKMSKIMKDPVTVPFPVTRGSAFAGSTSNSPGTRLGPRSLNRSFRKKELERINTENQQILRRIQGGRGVYNRDKVR